MSTQSNAVPEVISQVAEPAAIPVGRLIYWSVARELFESRSIYMAPLIAAALFLAGFLVSIGRLRRRLQEALPIGAAQQHDMLGKGYELAAALIMGTALIVGIFYTLDALYGERRDRSILFWKSLPVSDLVTVLSKFTVPIVVLPLVSFAITLATHLLMLLLSSLVLLGSGVSVAALWTHAYLFHVSLALLYHLLTVHGLWYAPLYGWLLMVSAWASRAPFIWAFLPPFVICGLEKIAFNTSYCLSILQRRLAGPEASGSMHSGEHADFLATLIPSHFFSEPGLWIGLAIAAIFLFGAFRLRRYRGPI